MEDSSNLEPEYGDFFTRFIAFFIDGILIALLSGSQEGLEFPVSFVYTLLFWHLKGATLGKMAVGVRIVDANLQKPPFWRLVVRYLAYSISFIFLGLGYIWIIFNTRKRGWHDLIAGTVVVKSNSIPEPL